MTKYFFFPALLLLIFMEGHSQQTTQTNSSTAARIRSASQAQTAYNSTTGGNLFTNGLTNRVAQPLSLTTDQKKSFNTALYNFFQDKSNFSKQKWSNPDAYQLQIDNLVQKLVDNLGTFLSPGQVSKFVAMKPASPRAHDPLITVFY